MPEQKWKAYKLEHNKNYEGEEDGKRFELFKENLKMIEEHNLKFEQGQTTYKMGLNHMSDWTQQEKDRLCGARPPK